MNRVVFLKQQQHKGFNPCEAESRLRLTGGKKREFKQKKDGKRKNKKKV